ncbi:MAG: aspartyl protease family protein [Oscillospiraceae bacterium]|nr:aspartyl protease family protein [Oscillospiraceae bacterium]
MSGSQQIKLPFMFVGKLPSFQIEMDGHTECFILDSGAPQMVINSKYETCTDALQSVKIAGAGGDTKEVFLKNVPPLLWGELTLQNQTALVLDLSHMEEKLNVRIRGLIGYTAIKDYDILYDYAQRTVTLINPQASKTNEMGTSYPLLFSAHPHIPIIPVSIKGAVYHMGIDCGAEGNLLDARCREPLHNAGAFMFEEDTALTDIAQAGAAVKSGALGPVSIYEKLCFDSMLFAFSDLSHLKAQGDVELDGIIGYEMLSRAKTLLSYARREIFFAKY